MTIRNLQAWVYTTDEGTSYCTAVDSTVAAQVGVSTNPKIGGADYTGSPALETLPPDIRPRGVYVLNGTNKRFVVCMTKVSELYDGTETAIDLPQLGVAAATYTRSRPRAERLPRRRNPAG